MGTSSAIPAVIDALIAQASTALPDVDVVDANSHANDPGDFLVIGNGSDIAATSGAGQASQAFATFGGSRTESGSISCVALSWLGDDNQKEARDRAFAMVAVIEGLVRADPTLGLTDFRYMTAQFGRVDELFQPPDDGACAFVTFTVTFEAVL